MDIVEGIVFNGSETQTVGIELELQIIDEETLELAPRSDILLDGVKDLDRSVKHELITSNLEVISQPSLTIKDVGMDISSRLERLFAECKGTTVLLSGGGTHPFSQWSKQEITEDPRYKRLLDKLQIIARRFSIFGLHIHIGVSTGDECIYVLNRMLNYLPYFLAVSASSPFWQGRDTGLSSYRSKVFENLPTAGLPFFLKDWEDYERLIKSYIGTGTIESIREIWWDLRPHPNFGTIELRICDMPLTIGEVLVIASIAQALTRRLSKEFYARKTMDIPHASVIRENKWRASRYGLRGDFITEDRFHTIPVKEGILRMLDFIEKEVEELDSKPYLNGIETIFCDGNGAERELRIWKESGDLKEVVLYMQRSLMEGFDEVKAGD